MWLQKLGLFGYISDIFWNSYFLPELFFLPAILLELGFHSPGCRLLCCCWQLTQENLWKLQYCWDMPRKNTRAICFHMFKTTHLIHLEGTPWHSGQCIGFRRRRSVFWISVGTINLFINFSEKIAYTIWFIWNRMVPVMSNRFNRNTRSNLKREWLWERIRRFEESKKEIQ